MRNNLWSPHPPSSYTVLVDGVRSGLGARPEFVGRPGLWNMFWLHSTKIDYLLDWDLAPERAPADTLALDKCIESIGYPCNGVTFEVLCEYLTAKEMIDRVLMRGCNPPIRLFWEEVSGGWLKFVEDRLKSFKSLHNKKGLLIQGSFPLQNLH